MEFGAFGDISYRGDITDNNRDAFVLGGSDLHATQSIDDKTRIFLEYVFEDSGDGFTIDLERLSITHAINSNFSVGAAVSIPP